MDADDNLLDIGKMVSDLRKLAARWDVEASRIDHSGDYRAAYVLIGEAGKLRECASAIEYREMLR